MRRHLAACSLLLIAVFLAACNSDEHQMMDQAEARWREGNYEDALRLYGLLYERDPRGELAARALLKIGDICYLNLRQIQKAADAYNKLIGELPGRPEEQPARKKLAEMYLNEIGDLTQAILQYDKLLELPDLEDRIGVRLQRAGAYVKQEDYHRALREFRRIEEEGISGHLEHQVYLEIGSIYQIQQKYDNAMACFQKVEQAPCPDCRRQAILNLASCRESLFDFDGAIESIRRLDASPENELLITREVGRLNEKRRRVESGSGTVWGRHLP